MTEQSEVPSQWTNEGFNQVFERLVKTEQTYTHAYLKAEEEHKKLFGTYRYKSYESFRGCRHTLLFGKQS